MILNEACSADDERLFDTDGGDGILIMMMIPLHWSTVGLIVIAMTRTMVTKKEAT